MKKKKKLLEEGGKKSRWPVVINRADREIRLTEGGSGVTGML